VQQAVSNSAMRVRGKAPDKFQNAPELRMGLELYYDAWFELDRDRNHGTGWTYIPWSSIARYIEFYDLTEDQAECMFAHIRAMDTAHINRLVEQNKDK
jgi:hypothetical protein